jgi:Cytidine and deoxycytidylate deaminase zinc-binding region
MRKTVTSFILKCIELSLTNCEMKGWDLAAVFCCCPGCHAFKLPPSRRTEAVKLSATPEDHSLRQLWNELSGISSASAVSRTSLYTEEDAVHMQRALREAQQAFDRGEVTTHSLLTVHAEVIKVINFYVLCAQVPIGAVVVDSSGTVLGSAGNAVEALHDATAHAEVQAMRAAAIAHGDWRLTGH